MAKPTTNTKGRRRSINGIVVVVLLLILAALVIIFGRERKQYKLADYFIQNQFILSGPESSVSAAIDAVQVSLSIQDLESVEENEYGSPPPGQYCPGLSRLHYTDEGQVFNLYSFTPDEDVTVNSIVQEIQRLQESPDLEFDGVRVDPNWIVGNPWEIEGGPWEIEGGTIDSGGESAPIDVFTGQAAFTATISLDTQAVTTSAEQSSHEVRVGVFDTSPFVLSVGVTRTETIDWVTEPDQLELNVLHPVPTATPEPDAEEGKAQNHGLFVAGLIHAIAPNSHIELIRVLEDNNRGNLYTLIDQLSEFVNSNNDRSAVINTSLGLRLLPSDAQDYEEMSRQAESLRDVLALARCSGIVVVAAAGNGSAELALPLRATSPADWSSVIGVVASNDENERSCYSNQGDISAPGGDGRAAGENLLTCEPRVKECKGGNCRFAVVGPVFKDPGDLESTGFGYWVGTSFAAPMVSGLAARILEESQGTLSPSQVQAIIECGATATSDQHLGAGVINVQRTLDECMPPT